MEKELHRQCLRMVRLRGDYVYVFSCPATSLQLFNSLLDTLQVKSFWTMSDTQVQTLARVNFPLYCVKAITERHILVAGGGGKAKTGISNTCEVYELFYDSKSNTCKANQLTHYDTVDHAIMNLCLIPKFQNEPGDLLNSKYHFYLPTGGMDGICNVYEMKLQLKNGLVNGVNAHYDDNSSSNRYLRRRHFSLSSQHSVEDIEENVEECTREGKGPPINDKKPSANAKPATSKNDHGIPDYTYDFKLKTSFQTDFKKDEPYQKKIKYSDKANRLFSAGADGVIRVWSVPDFEMVMKISAHSGEVDDIDIHPSGSHLVSVSSSDTSTVVWQVANGQRVIQLDHATALPSPRNSTKAALAAKAKYISRGCRYSTVEGDETNVRLYVILNPLVRTKPMLDSYICKWAIHNDQYRVEKIVSAGDMALSTMCISDDGRFLAVGTLDGDVDVYIAFSLQRCYHLTKAHNLFVTGLEFLPNNPPPMDLTGLQADSALVSISVDNHIVLHKIPKRAYLGFLETVIFYILFMFLVYFTMNYFDL